MGQELIVSLWITLIGMGLVFGAILLLWGVLTLITRLTADKGMHEISISGDAAEDSELALKQRAAVAAVAVALQYNSNTQPHEFPLPDTALVSAWQAVMRSKMLTKRGPVR